ncbi:MAG: 5'-nucleotidase C-terminal domain-containing protein [Clostridia bacterium]|nr:5'-nucleotidase C-terminal domain-containing protein [Clostridia bacterium]
MKRTTILIRAAAVLLTLTLTMVFIGGCAKTQQTQDSPDLALSVLIPTTGRSFDDLIDLLNVDHPEIAFEKTGYSGGNSSAFIQRRFLEGDLTDIILATYVPDGELQEKTMLELSGYDFIQNYKASVLNNLDVNGSIYFLEGPSSVRGIVYNKTLFDEKGWEKPQNHEQFVALISQIRAESDIMPIAIPGKHTGTYFTLMSELSHCDFLQTPSGAAWEQAFAKGEVSSKEGFATGIELLQDWVDAGAFDKSQTTAGDTEDYNMLVNRECAMAYVVGKHSLLVELTDASEDEFAMMPLYGLGEDSSFCATGYGIKIGLNKKLGEPGNEKKLENALKLLELFSTEEGQMTSYSGIGDTLTLVGSNSELPPLFDGIKETMNAGHTSPFLYTGYTDIIAPAGEYLRNVCAEGGDLSGVFDVMDDLRRASLESEGDIYIATVEQTLDERQTAQFVANALNAQGLGDFALVSMGEYNAYFNVGGGANGKIYDGGIETNEVIVPLSSYSARSIMTLSLTGAKVRELLEQGYVLSDGEGYTASLEYFSSGLDVVRDDDGSVKSVGLNSAPLEDDAIYTVAFSPLDYCDETAAAGNPQDTGVVWASAFRDYITSLGTITPQHAQ